MAVCSIKCIDLTTEAIKILVVHISDNRENIREKISLICKTFQIYGDINRLTYAHGLNDYMMISFMNGN